MRKNKMEYDISVIVLNYNSSKDSIMRTLKSVINQRDCKFEIIFADDGSEIDSTNEIHHFLKTNYCTDFYIVEDKIHLGTIKNIMRALEYAHGKYVKLIGCGDLLFSSDTLSTVVEYMNSTNSICTFVDIQAFCIEKNIVHKRYFRTPINYHHFKTGNTKKIIKDIVYLNDYILGAALFYEFNILKKYLKELSYSVTYFEDWIQVLLVLNNYSIDYLPIPGVLYEIGSGISTVHSESRNLLYLEDEKKFWNYLEKKYNCKYIKLRNNYRQKESRAASKSICRLLFLLIKYLSHPYYRICKLLRWKKCVTKDYGLGFFTNNIDV